MIVTNMFVVNGTSYYNGTNPKVIEALEYARNKGIRISLSYGDKKTGRDWMEENWVDGYVGRSTGVNKIPLLLSNRKSIGGGAILTDAIVRIRYSDGKQILYQHPKYHHAVLTIRKPIVSTHATPSHRDRYAAAVYADGHLHAQFRTKLAAERFVKKFG